MSRAKEKRSAPGNHKAYSRDNMLFNTKRPK